MSRKIVFSLLALVTLSLTIGLSSNFAPFIDVPSLLFVVLFGGLGVLAKADKLEIQELLRHGKMFLYAGFIGTLLGLVISFAQIKHVQNIRFAAAVALLTGLYGFVIYYFTTIFRKD